MRTIIIALTALLLSFTPAYADASVKIGRLSCEVEAGIGLILGSSKSMTCSFYKNSGGSETYTGRITKVGLDIGVTQKTRIEWLVFTGGTHVYHKGALSGTYVGASAEASVGLGGGANWLVGGSRDSFMLQPWSVQGQVGLNLAVGLAGLTLD
ncbi:MAG TPA: DUF992 domain-containing protein [Devosia sp.]|nr:DUF992 domain-containing protein [Devosia sp.]